MKSWEIEKLFKEDIRDKKKTGSGSFHQRGKGVKHGISGALRTSSYYMSNKEKKKLNGEVRVFNMYESIIPVNEFELKDIETQKLMLSRWRDIFDNYKIKEEMGLSNKAYYDLVAKLDLPKKPRGGPHNTGEKKARKAKASPKPSKPTLLDMVAEDVVKTIKEPEKAPTIVEQTVESVKLLTNGLHLEYNGNYDADSINKILTKIQLLVDGEPNKFRISLSLSEIGERET